MRTLRKYNEHGLLFAASATRAEICGQRPSGKDRLTKRFKLCTTAWPTSCLPTSHIQIFHRLFRFSSCRLITSDPMTKTPTAWSGAGRRRMEGKKLTQPLNDQRGRTQQLAVRAIFRRVDLDGRLYRRHDRLQVRRRDSGYKQDPASIGGSGKSVRPKAKIPSARSCRCCPADLFTLCRRDQELCVSIRYGSRRHHNRQLRDDRKA